MDPYGHHLPPAHYPPPAHYAPPPPRDPRDDYYGGPPPPPPSRYDDRRYDDRRDFDRRDDYYRRDPRDDYRRDDYRRRRDSRSRSPPRRYDDRGGRDRFRDSRPPRRNISPSARGVPEPCNVLGVFGLSILTRERDLEKLFGEFGPIKDIAILFDKQTQKSRGFGFITFEDVEAATKAREAMNGYEFNERRMRVDFSLTKRGHDSTPGQYMGRPDQVRDGGRPRGDDVGGRRDRERGDRGDERREPETGAAAPAAFGGEGAGEGRARGRSYSPAPRD
ncbi:RNA-binding domain-containing protein [Rhizoclosmatium globosum]|uniref:RNA-binding domain-containing protein n=1 Tax=Rhizoclosmatium globosum TaxID=329046 RepID=A0A1Y2CKV8_9FUNG|nr:RNA-binding domain-containing protein [Rhizoclosmatium globosum]|eukprot:ORY47652.1 RNA-binding domain-containing protein [Rhizoclosmatium globosum]